MTGSPSPYAPGIIADDRPAPRPAGRLVVFLVATFVSTVVASGTLLFERAQQAELENGTKRMMFLSLAAGAPRLMMLLWAFLSDRFPLWGTRREGYVLFTALLAPIAWLLTTVGGDRLAAWIVAATIFGAASAISHAATSGAVAEIGQRRAATGRVGAAYLAIAQLGVVATFGMSAASELASPWLATGAAIGLSLAVVALIIVLPEDGTAPPPPAPTVRPSIPRFLGSRAFWGSFAVCALAGAATVPKELVVEPQQTAEGAAVYSALAPWLVHACFIGAAAIYFLVCRLIRFGILLRVTLVAKAVALLAYPMLAGAGSASIAFIARATANGLLSAALLDLALRVAPPGREAFGTILLASVTGVVIFVTNALADRLGVPDTRVATFAAAAAIAAALAAILLPRRFVEGPDGRDIKLG